MAEFDEVFAGDDQLLVFAESEFFAAFFDVEVFDVGRRLVRLGRRSSFGRGARLGVRCRPSPWGRQRSIRSYGGIVR